jgi:hypothetical protein
MQTRCARPNGLASSHNATSRRTPPRVAANPGDLLDSGVAGISAQPGGDQPGEGVDLEIQHLDQPQQRVDPRTGLDRQPGTASSCCPPAPNKSLMGTCTPAAAYTAWIWFFRLERSPTSLARCRTQPRNSRVAGGAIQASGSRPIRSKSGQIRGIADRFHPP